MFLRFAFSAELGCSGKWRNNISRDLLRRFSRSTLANICDPVYVDCLAKTQLSSHVEDCQLPMILPHMFIAGLYKRSQLQFWSRFAGVDTQEHASTIFAQFWDNMSDSELLAHHPDREAIWQEPHTSVPLKLHGDGAPVTKHSGLDIVSVSSPLSRMSTMLTRCLVFAINDKQVADLSPFHTRLRWSLDVLSTGKWPDRDHAGAEFTDPVDRGRAGSGFVEGFVSG